MVLCRSRIRELRPFHRLRRIIIVKNTGNRYPVAYPENHQNTKAGLEELFGSILPTYLYKPVMEALPAVAFIVHDQLSLDFGAITLAVNPSDSSMPRTRRRTAEFDAQYSLRLMPTSAAGDRSTEASLDNDSLRYRVSGEPYKWDEKCE